MFYLCDVTGAVYWVVGDQVTSLERRNVENGFWDEDYRKWLVQEGIESNLMWYDNELFFNHLAHRHVSIPYLLFERVRDHDKRFVEFTIERALKKKHIREVSIEELL